MKSFVSQLADFGRFCLVVVTLSLLAAGVIVSNGPSMTQAERSALPEVQDPPLDGLHSETIFSLQYRYGDEVGR
jgi:hypothetical protein